MVSGMNAKEKNAQRPVLPEELFESKKTFSVILEGIRSEVETRDTFTIKFSLLTKAPLSKMKHLMTSLPATVWTGPGRSRAESILTLIEEAGGKGSIIEGAAASPVKESVQEPKSERTCTWCGFPLKEGETVCGFCMTSVDEGAPKMERHRPSGRRLMGVRPKRLLVYGIVLAIEIVVLLLYR
jgi:predicted nucleic acid-binding Zn ribbon protein